MVVLFTVGGVYAEEVLQLLVEMTAGVHAVGIVGGGLNRHDGTAATFVLVVLGLGSRGGGGRVSWVSRGRIGRGRGRGWSLIVGVFALFRVTCLMP